MTSDEKRCVSFFLYRTIPSLTTYFDSSLWQKIVLQMSCTDPAVCHAVIALSAVNQDLERHGLPMPGSTTAGGTLHRFVLEHSMRSFGLLNKRRILKDPQLREVILVCCLLFVVLELACGHFDDATAHLQSGLAILKEMKIQHRRSKVPAIRIEESLLEAFLQLESQAAQHGVIQPTLHIDNQVVYEQGYEEYLFRFQTLQDVRQALSPIVNAGLPFLEQWWSRPEEEIMANYGVLHTKQQRLLSCVSQFGMHLASFHDAFYHRLTKKEQKGADMIKVMYLTMMITLKTCLYTRSCPEPASFMGDYEELLKESLAVMEQFQDRPIMTVDVAICPPLFAVAARCPDYGTRFQALDALRSWPHCEGYLNSTLIADLVVEGMKEEMRHLWTEMNTTGCLPPPGVSFESMGEEVIVHINDRLVSLEPSKALADALSSLRTVTNWQCVRTSGILLRKIASY
ncbi:hypothetical protein BDW59DRAFT_149629 [Aspergillus cavernicola]|uniref:C6 zinc finger domain protein n=1 Tax=Aspergillus cavernicola TaxID=176166 RepID=A0ABR4I3C7_9EURO